MNAARATLGVLGLLLLLSGCGQKGPLYLPERRPQAVTPPTPASETPSPQPESPPPAPASPPRSHDPDDSSAPQ